MVPLTKMQKLFGILVLLGFVIVTTGFWFLRSSPSIASEDVDRSLAATDPRYLLSSASPLPCRDDKLSALPAHTKLIEVATEEPWFHYYTQLFGSFKGCRVDDCHLTRCQSGRTPDALTFTAETPSARVLQPKALGQVWVFITMESPITVHEMNRNFDPDLYAKFDLAMTYRDDSDIYLPYFTLEKQENPLRRDLTDVLKQKRGLVAQVASHCECQSRRADYIRLMQKYIPVDVFGKCGNRTCGADCFQMISKQYKFYLAFENSFCAGYVSDHFSEMYELDAVPVTRGNANYSKLLPPKTHIDTKSFPTVKALAAYLEHLDRNDTAYMEYLEAKARYRYKNAFIMNNQALCDLCYHMHTKIPTKRRSDFRTWWSKNTSCVEPTDIV